MALFSGKIYTVGKNFTRPQVVTVATNLNSAYCYHFRISVPSSICFSKTEGF